MKPTKKDSYIDDLKSFVGKIVEVEKLAGEKVRGKCLSISFNHLNVIIETEEQVIVLKNISSITKSR